MIIVTFISSNNNIMLVLAMVVSRYSIIKEKNVKVIENHSYKIYDDEGINILAYALVRVTVTYHQDEISKPDVYLHYLNVSRDYRRHGLGTHLLRTICSDWCAYPIEVRTQAENLPFFEQFGFVIKDRNDAEGGSYYRLVRPPQLDRDDV